MHLELYPPSLHWDLGDPLLMSYKDATPIRNLDLMAGICVSKNS